MIGTNIRSIRHLHRVSDTSLKTVLIKFKENSWDVCKVMKTTKDSPFGETLFVFNDLIRQSHWGIDTLVSSECFKNNCKYNEVNYYPRLLSIDSSDFVSYSHLFGEIVLLPDSFEKDYEKFLKENSKNVGNLMSSYGLSSRDINVKRLYIYTDGSKNFFQWAINVYYKHGISMQAIRDILTWNESYKQLSKNLSKGTITAYTSKDAIFVLLGELSELRKEKRINDSINSFNTFQKKMLKEATLSDDDKQALWKLSRLSELKRLNFIRKMSSVTDLNELLRQLKFITSVHFSWSKESFLDFVENVEEIKYEKIFENDRIVLVKILDYETVKQLGKTTNWCISKNKHYWNNYIENYHGQTTQYMVFDFSKVEDDKLSIIGFTTTHNKGITSAHNFVNDDLMGGGQTDQILLNSFIEHFKENRNIYTILDNLGVDITLLVEYDAPSYEWNKDSLMDYLYECVNPENVEILSSKDDKMVMSVIDGNIRYFFGDAYHDNIPSEYYTLQHIIFIDFGRNKYDINKIQFGVIEEGSGDEDYCNCVFNERSLNNGKNFDSLLIEFGMPYNTIRRTNNPIVRLKSGITSFNTPMINECIRFCSSEDIKKTIIDEIGRDYFYDLVVKSVDDYMSFDYLNLIYDNKLKLKDIMSIEHIGDMIKHFSVNMRNLSRASNIFSNMEGVTNKEIDDFYGLKIERREDAKYIGYYIIIKMIIENENVKDIECNVMCKKFLSLMFSFGKQSDVYEQILDLIKDRLKYSTNSSAAIEFLAKYTAYFGSQPLKEFMAEKAKNNKYFSEQLERHNAEAKKNEKHKSVGATVFTTAPNSAYVNTFN